MVTDGPSHGSVQIPSDYIHQCDEIAKRISGTVLQNVAGFLPRSVAHVMRHFIILTSNYFPHYLVLKHHQSDPLMPETKFQKQSKRRKK
jgi:hypothetical protein